MDRPLSTILVPVDFSVHAERALEWAIELARPGSAVVHVVHALDVPDLVGMTGTWWSTLRGRAVELLDRCADRVDAAGIACERKLIEGKPVDAILEEARSCKADLIVIGSHGAGARRLVLGSVAERVLRLAPCPVLTVRDPQT